MSTLLRVRYGFKRGVKFDHATLLNALQDETICPEEYIPHFSGMINYMYKSVQSKIVHPKHKKQKTCGMRQSTLSFPQNSTCQSSDS